MKKLLSLSAAALALVLSSCSDYYGYDSGYSTSTVSIHGGGSRGYYPSSYRNYGYVNPSRSYYPVRNVYAPSRSSHHGSYTGYNHGNHGNHRPPSRQVSHVGHGHRDQRPTSAPTHRDHRPMNRSPQPDQRQHSAPSNRRDNGKRESRQPSGMTMASYQPSSSANRSSRGSSSSHSSTRGSRGSAHASSSRDGRSGRGR